jgi:hypothetical protein
MADGAVVHRGTVTVHFDVREWQVGESRGEPELRYDWIADTGNESAETFDSIEQATTDAYRTLGG